MSDYNMRDTQNKRTVNSSSRRNGVAIRTGRGTSRGVSLNSIGTSPGNARQPKRKKGRKGRKGKNQATLVFCVVIVLALACLAGFLTRKNGAEVYVGEANVGVIKNKSLSVEDLVNTVTAQLESERGAKVQLNEEITMKPVHVKKDQIYTSDYIISQVKNTVTYKVEAAAVMADGAVAAILNNTEEANGVLDRIMAEYIPENAQIVKESSGFVQNVEVVAQYVDSVEIITADEAFEKLTAGTKTQKPYTIATGDSLYKIASTHDMSVEEVLAQNPGMTISTTLVVGQSINILTYTPLLSVKTVENQTYTEKVAKKTEYREDNTKDSSYQKVVQQGKDGQREVTVQVTRINGFEDSTKEVSEKILQEPVTEIIVRGTK